MARLRLSGRIVFGLLVFSSLASAWPSWLPELDALIVRRDDATATSPTASPAQTTAPSSSATDSQASSSDSFQFKSTNLNTGGVSVTGSHGGGNSTAAPTHTEYNPQDPAGAVVMVTPAPILGTQLYKIGNTLTWAWNYTNLQGTPTAVDVLVSCSTASNTWTLTQNMTFATDGSFTWDTNAYKQTAVASPLLTEQYTLLIYDADGSASETPGSGYLAPFNGFVFGMYTPQPYTPLSDWTCATCSGALSELDRKALGFALTMSIITVLSFTWFVTGLFGLA